MSFQKTGDAVPIEKILCSCGQELQPDMEVCPKCKKKLQASDRCGPCNKVCTGCCNDELLN